MGKGEVIILSKHTILPSPRADDQEEESPKRLIHLSPLDLNFISMDYIQKGILFHKPTTQKSNIDLTITSLLSSFSATLDYFYPLAGRLVTTNHTDDSLSISLDCTDLKGAQFIRATALHLIVSDILTPNYYIPPIVHSFFFPRGRLVNHDGHTEPLLFAQVTELADGIFIGITLNHAVADGTSFWHFLNTWSEICRTNRAASDPPIFERRDVPLIRLPFRKAGDFIKKVQLPTVEECFFHFPADTVAKLKSKANAEINNNYNYTTNKNTTKKIKISSLQSLLAQVWRSVTRARGLEPEEETTYVTFVGLRTRLRPPLPNNYFGNLALGVPTKATAGDVAEKGLGWVALQLNRTFASQDEARAREWIGSWIENPSFASLGRFGPADVLTGSSPRFDVYDGNDFGWGRPVAVRSGPGAKAEGKVTVYPGPETGSMGLEVCLSPETLAALLRDGEFMELVG